MTIQLTRGNLSDHAASLNESERRFVKCPICDGSGEPYDGVKCAECDGFGTAETECEPITLEDLGGCFDHDVEEGVVCEACAEYERDKTDAEYAQRLYDMADATRKSAPSLAKAEDREALMQWAAHLEKSGSEIFGRLQREADREASQNEETTSGYLAWRPA